MKRTFALSKSIKSLAGLASLVGLALCCLLLPATAQAQAYQQQQQRVSRAAELEKDLRAFTLSPAQLQAFELRAQQKLSDFYGYVGYQANPGYALMNSITLTPRRSAALFADTTVRIEPLFSNGPALPPIAFMEQTEALPYDEVTVRLDSMVWQKNLGMQHIGLYQGQCTYTLQAVGFKNGKAQKQRQGRQQATVWVRQVEKSFGKRGSELVWEVLLGNISWQEEGKGY